MTRLRTALVGTGKVAQTHALALASLPESRFSAVCGIDAQQLDSFRARYGVAAYTDVSSMVRDERIEAVTICTPHPTHAELAIAALQAGAHVLVEKPMALTTVDCDWMIAAAQQSGRQLGVVSQRRLYRPVQRVRDAIDQGKIGRPVLGVMMVLGWRSPEYYQMDGWRGSWAGEGGGVLVNQAVHQLDLFQWLLGPPAELYGGWANFNHPTIEVEDTAIAAIRFRSGALGSLVASNSQDPGLFGYIHVHGQNGATVGVQTESGSLFISGVTTAVDPPFNDLWTVPGEADRLPEWQALDRAEAAQIDLLTVYHVRQVQDFLQAVSQGRPPLVPGSEGRKSVALFEAIYASQRARQPIAFAADGSPVLPPLSLGPEKV